MSTHAITPRPSLGFCCHCGAAGLESRTPAGHLVGNCPNGHAPWLVRTAATRADELAMEIADLPRALVREVFERIEAVAPERAKPLARYAAKQAEESIWDVLLSSKRVTVPR